MRSWLQGLMLLVAMTTSEGFRAPMAVNLGGRGRVSVAHHRVPLYDVRTPRMPRISLRSTQATKEECDGPAKSGEVGNVDMKATKVKSEEIKTDAIINLSPAAITQIGKIRASRGNEEVVLRVGVRAGGCSGMSYVMEFEDASKVGAKDTEIKYDGFRVVVDPKSLMFIYGMTLNYSDALIGGGFQFSNPNAESTCGCGQSFGT